MADSKITDLTANTAPVSTDLLLMVDDPAGSPLSQKLTFGTLNSYVNNNPSVGFTTTATAAGTTTLTSSSTYWQFFTGTTTQTVVLPNATTMSNGMAFYIDNNSTRELTVQMNGGSQLIIIPALSDCEIVLESNGTSAGSWDTNLMVRGGITPSEEWCKLTATYTLANQGTAQKLFNASTNGAITVTGSTHYFFECLYSISSMSGTSGNAAFSLAGTATLTNVHFCNIGIDATNQTTVAALNGAFASTAATAASSQTAGTGTAMWSLIKGEFTVNAGGTVIPSITLVTAVGTAVVAVGSYFRLTRMGASSQSYVGNWS